MIDRRSIDPDFELSDCEAIRRALEQKGYEGFHSRECSNGFFSHNASQRMKDLVTAGVKVFTARENRGRRPGSRYWLEAFAPDFAVPVRANRSSESSSTGDSDTAGGLSSDAQPADGAGSHHPAPGTGATPSDDAMGTGQLFPLPPERPRSALTDKEAA